MKKITLGAFSALLVISQGQVTLNAARKLPERARQALQVAKNKKTGRTHQKSRVLQSLDSVSATLTAFGGDNRFFLAGAPDATTKSLTRAFLGTDQNGARLLQLQPLALDTQVNENGFNVEQSPLNNQTINTLTLAGPEKRPVVTTMEADPEGSSETTYPHTYVVKTDDGRKLLSGTPDFTDNSNFIFDGDPFSQKVTTPPVASAATGSSDGDFVVLAVPQKDEEWGVSIDGNVVEPAGDGRGLAFLRINDNPALQSLDVVNFSGSGAVPVSGVAGGDLEQFPERTSLGDKGPISFFAPRDPNTSSRASLGNNVDMYWDKQLKRLFVGLSDVTRGDAAGNPNLTPNVSAGACSVLVGRFTDGNGGGELRGGEGGAGEGGIGEGEGEGGGGSFDPVGFSLEPVIKNASSYLFPEILTNDGGATLGDASLPEENFADKYILGFYRPSDQNFQEDLLFATARHVRVMHTSTGRSYLIVNGGVAASFDGVTPPDQTNVQMYAVPLVDKGPDDPATGFVARNDDVNKVVNVQPIIDEALINQSGNESDASNELYDVYHIDGDTTTYSAPGTDVSDITDQATFRTFIKNAMPLSSNPAQRIGGTEDPVRFNQLLSFDGSTDIRDVQVHGDTVYVAAASTRDFNHIGESGIFASTALFNATGEISAWTPWQRVMGNTDAVYGMGFDESSSNFWYFTTDGGGASDDPSVVSRTRWGLGDPQLHDGDANAILSSVIAEIFPPASGGVLGLFSFGPDTPGFRPRVINEQFFLEDRHDQFSMMVATGTSRVALIETGSRLRFQNGTFEPTTAFQLFVHEQGDDATANVYVFSPESDDDRGLALAGLGAITTAELARLPLGRNDELEGWLFVGGESGVAVLVQGYDGHGWFTGENEGLEVLLPGTSLQVPGSSSTDFPGGRRWFFVQLVERVEPTEANPEGGLNIFSDVRKLVSDGDKYLYILTGTGLFRVEMNALNFSVDRNSSKLQARIPSDNIHRLATMSESQLFGTNLPIGDSGDQFFDMMVIKRDRTLDAERNTILIGTSKGLFVTDEIVDGFQDVSAATWQQVVTVNDLPLGPAVRFDFSSTERGKNMVVNGDTLCARGNLQVTAFDPALTMFAQYRFTIDNGFITPFTEVFGTDYFYKIGNLVDPGNRQSNQLPAHDSFYARTNAIPGSARGFVDRVPVLPHPNSFLKDTETGNFNPINLAFNIELPLQLAAPVRDHASGAIYFPGQFGVRVNE